MTMKHSSRSGFVRPVALFTTGAILVPTLLAGCSGGAQQNMTPPPAMDRSTSAPPPALGTTGAAKPGLTTKQKVVLLAGAAALYYAYRKYNEHNKATSATGVQYYQSKANGRIYYRDPKTHQAIYVTPPTQPISVPANEAAQYQSYAGYNQQPQGQNFGGYGYDSNNQYSGQPGSVPAPSF